MDTLATLNHADAVTTASELALTYIRKHQVDDTYHIRNVVRMTCTMLELDNLDTNQIEYETYVEVLDILHHRSKEK